MIEIKPTDAGVPTALIEGRYLHSPRDPVREASRTVEQLARRAPPCVVILGFGLGYQAEALLAATQSTHLVVYEPDRDLAEELRPARDVETIVTSHRLTWCDTLHSLQEALVDHGAAGFEIVSLQARRLADPQPFSAADTALAAFRSRIEINANTLSRFGRLWVRNLCHNVDVLATGIPVARLDRVFRGLPGFLLAAGPGLEQVLRHLPALSERAVVVAVDTAVAVCQDHGVEPDIAVVVDPQYWNARHLDRVESSRTLLVAESSTHPSVFAHFRSPPVFCSSLFPLGRAMEAVLGPMGTLGTGGSVSTTAWDLLRFAGCSPIYLAGLDLGFPNGRTHFRGSFFEVLAVARGGRLSPAEKTLHRYVWSADPHPVDATDGSMVLTDRRMELYRNWFAKQVTQSNSPPTFTLSTGGVRIDGIEPAAPESLLSLPTVRGRVKESVAAIQPMSTTESAQSLSAVRSQLQRLAADLTPLEEIAEEAIVAIETIHREVEAGGQPDFTPLKSIDSDIQSYSGRTIVSFLMQQAISQIRAGFGSATVHEQIEASRQLYGELLDSVRFHIQSIRQTIPEE